jgi:hypothetical protein
MLRGGVARGQDGPREAAWLGSVMVSVKVVEPGVQGYAKPGFVR